MRPLATSPTTFTQIAQEVNDSDRFVDAGLIRTIKQNHNFIVGRRTRRDRLVSHNIDCFSMSPVSEYPGEICFSAIVPLSLNAREVVVGVEGNGDIVNNSEVRIYPFIVPIGLPVRIDLTNFIDLNNAASTSYDATVECKGVPQKSESGYSLWLFGIVSELTLTNTSLVGPLQITSVLDNQLRFAGPFNTNYVGHALITDTGKTEYRRIVDWEKSLLPAAPDATFVIGKTFSKKPVPLKNNMTVYQVLHGAIYQLTLREKESSDFSFVAGGV